MTPDFESLFSRMNARALERREARRRAGPKWRMDSTKGRAMAWLRAEKNRVIRYRALLGRMPAIEEFTIRQLADLWGIGYHSAHGWVLADMCRPGSRLERTEDGRVRLRREG